MAGKPRNPNAEAALRAFVESLSDQQVALRLHAANLESTAITPTEKRILEGRAVERFLEENLPTNTSSEGG